MKDKKIINAKCKRVKKPLTDKQKDERKHKFKKVCKTVLDVIVYMFAGFMFIGLIFGCFNQYKKASASFYSDNYTSLNQVSYEQDDSLRLYYYYTVDYKKTFPDYASLVSSGLSISSTNNHVVVNLRRSYILDNKEYTQITCDITNSTAYLRIYGNSAGTLTLVSFTISDVVINRPDVISSLFGGSYGLYVPNPVQSKYFYRWLVYYLSNKGYSRVNYSMPMSPTSFNYLLVSSSNEDNMRGGGLIFRNDSLYADFPDGSNSSYPITIFEGCFRSNGVLYSHIEISLSTVYGNYLDSDGIWKSYYYFDYDNGLNTGNTRPEIANSANDFFKGWYYVSRIAYVDFNGLKNTVWTIGEWFRHDNCYVNLTGSWSGDSETSISPYRDIYIMYAFDSVTNSEGNFEYFPSVSHASYAQYMNLIGDGYISQIPGGLQDDNSGYFTNIFSWVSMALTGLLPLLGYSLVPGITIATIIMIPVSVTIILFVVKLFKR